jgi:stage III sporulation protein AE
MKRFSKRLLILVVWLLFGAAVLVLPVAATADGLAGAGEGIEEEYRDFVDALPPEVVERLPDGLFPEDESTDFGRVSEAVTDMTRFSFLAGAVGDILSVEWGTAWRLLLRTVGLLLISALAGTLCRTFRSEALTRALSLGVTCAVFLNAVSTVYAQLSKVSDFLRTLTATVNTLMPLMAALHVMGGNVGVAAAQNATLMLFLTVCENVCGRTVLPSSALCLCLAAASVLAPGLLPKGIGGMIKNGYTKTLGFIMLLLSFVLSTQTALRAASDSLAARTAKFVAGNLIPVVGGALGDSFRTVASGVSFLKSTVGVGAMLVLFLMLLPVLISLLTTRLSMQISVAVSDLLGCEAESRLLAELLHVWGLLIAVVSLCSVLLIFALTLFVRVSTA